MKITLDTIKYSDTQRIAPVIIFTADNHDEWNQLSDMYLTMIDMTDDVNEVLDCVLDQITRQLTIEIAVIDKRLYMNPYAIEIENNDKSNP